MSFYLDPTRPALPIPALSMQHMESLLQQKSKSYTRIFQITMENVPEGIVGIYTDKEGRYYRVSKESVLQVNRSFSENTDPETEKVNKLNALITEIINQPDQFQLQVHAPVAMISREAVRQMFTASMSTSGMVLRDVLECHPRAPGVGFYVGVGMEQ